jgi:5'(3')-deoxyribonucleotidase
MKRPVVGVDVDGVLADLLTPAFELLARRYGLVRSMADMTTWHLDDLLPEALRVPFWRDLGASGYLHDQLLPYPGAVEGLARLRAAADIFVVTSYLRHAPTWVHERDAWLERHFGVNRQHIVHTGAKHVVRLDALIDDRPENIHAWQAAFPEGDGILWAQPYNTVHGARHRTDSWDEALAIILRRRG